MKFNLDALVAEYENLEAQLSDPSIFSDQKKWKKYQVEKNNFRSCKSL